MDQGVGVAEAARRVGVGRSTGWRWRHVEQAAEQAAAAAVAVREARRAARATSWADLQEMAAGLDPLAGRGRWLVLAEREIIALGRLTGIGVRAMAGLLGRAPSTVSREIARHSRVRAGGEHLAWDSLSRAYHPYAADRAARENRRRPKTSKLAGDPLLHAVVADRLGMRWSPEQIAHTLPGVFPDQPERHIVHETIYQALYLQGRGELRREVAAALRTGRARRRPRRDPHARQHRFVEPMVMISERPAEVADRAVPGHWEGDLIIGRDNGSAIATIVERNTRYLLLAHLPAGRDALAVRDALIATMSSLPGHLARSLTWDQGSEMARHHEFQIATGIPVYFCDPGTPWMRGSNENTNGLLRQYFPKGTDLSVHSAEHLAGVAAELNGRPRETLGWNSPAQRLATLLANKQ